MQAICTFGHPRTSRMESQEPRVSSDPFQGQPAQCPCCGAPFPAAGTDVGEWVASYVAGFEPDQMRVVSNTLFRGRCSECGTALCAPGTGKHTLGRVRAGHGCLVSRPASRSDAPRTGPARALAASGTGSVTSTPARRSFRNGRVQSR